MKISIIFLICSIFILSNTPVIFAEDIEEDICDCPTDSTYIIEVESIDSTTALPLSFKDSTVYSCVPIEGREDCPVAEKECGEINDKESEVTITSIRTENYLRYYDLSVATSFTCGDGTSCSISFTTTYSVKDCSLEKTAWELQKAKADHICAEQLTQEMKDEICYIQKQALTEAQNELTALDSQLEAIEQEIIFEQSTLNAMEQSLADHETELARLNANTANSKALMDTRKQELDAAIEIENAVYLNALMKRGAAGFLGIPAGIIGFVADTIANWVTGTSPYKDAHAAVVAAQHNYDIAKSAYDSDVLLEQQEESIVQSYTTSISEKQALIEQKNTEKADTELSIESAGVVLANRQAEYDACPADFDEECNEARALESTLKDEYDLCQAAVLG